MRCSKTSTIDSIDGGATGSSILYVTTQLHLSPIMCTNTWYKVITMVRINLSEDQANILVDLLERTMSDPKVQSWIKDTIKEIRSNIVKYLKKWLGMI